METGDNYEKKKFEWTGRLILIIFSLIFSIELDFFYYETDT